MEETDLKATASASNQNPNPELATDSKDSKTREEGELSSSDNEENSNDHVICSAASTVSVLPPAGLVTLPPENKCTQGIETGKSVSGDDPSVFLQSALETTIDKIKVSSKTTTPTWGALSGANTNLVISFSDDDSGSNSEDCSKEKPSNSRSNTVSQQRAPTSLPGKSNKLCQTARNANKVMPMKLPLNRTIISSMTKIHEPNPRGKKPAVVQEASLVRKSNTLNRNRLTRVLGYDQDMGVNNSKLQDLREQIALRENELKLKFSLQNKELISVSSRDNGIMNLNNDVSRKSNASLSDFAQLEPKERDKKRLKVTGSYSNQLSSGGPEELPGSNSTRLIVPPKGVENRVQDDVNKVDYKQKRILVGGSESSAVKWKKQEDKPVGASEFLPRGVQAGTDTVTNFNQFDSGRRVENCSVLDHTALLPNMNSNIVSKKINSVELNHKSKIDRQQPSASILNTKTTASNLTRNGACPDVISNHKTLAPSNCLDQASTIVTNLWNGFGKFNGSGHSRIDMRSLVEMEESLDKDLEEAQEHRHRCEIEERNAFKAYRKAQGALAEANAKCVDLYHKRELYSAHIRSLIMENSSLIFSSSHQMQPEYDGIQQSHTDPDIQHANLAHLSTSDQHTNGRILDSEHCSEPDGNTSELLPYRGKNAAVGVCSPSSDCDPNTPVDDDQESFPFNRETSEAHGGCHIQEKYFKDRQKDISNESRIYSSNSAHDSLHLEAKLRSELFAKLLNEKLSKNSGLFYNEKPAMEQGAINDVRSERSQPNRTDPVVGQGDGNDMRCKITRINNENDTVSDAEENQLCNFGGTNLQERNLSKEIQNHSHVEKFPLNVNHCHSTASDVRSPPLKSAFRHMKAIPQVSVEVLQTVNQRSISHDIYNEAAAVVDVDGIRWSKETVNSLQECGREIGSYTCSPAVDPFWPLCVYELRGKCNNDECPWQHIKDCSNENMEQNKQGHSKLSDCHIGLSLPHGNCDGVTKGSKHQHFMTPPIYLVGLEIMKADPHSYESILARKSQSWKKYFTIFLTISSLLQKDLPADGPFLHDGRIEVQGNCNGQLSYFQSRNGKMNQSKEALDDDDRTVEMALLIINQEVNKLEGFKKALPVLSRAVEADPTSSVLWIVYLLLYYSDTKTIGKDDMFSYAVKHNKQAYELWLMFINSRTKLEDRLTAYDAAFSALCCRASESDKDGMRNSACILDLFLQMMDCLCMSGNIEKAIRTILGLFPVATDSDDSHHSFISDVPSCLTVSDKCILWVSCLHLVIYRKLPDSVLHQFECEKEVVELEWPAIHLVDDEKQRALRLVERAVNSVDSSLLAETLKSTGNPRSAQSFALNHIRCLVALGSLESRNLLDKYVKLYPSCLELVLTSARIKEHNSRNVNFEGFEEALRNWPKEVPGIQCIWNQYAEYALQNKRFEYAEEVMLRWFRSDCKIEHLQNRMESINDSISSQKDKMFGYLNLSLLRLLQKDHLEARLAIDNALKAASPENFKYCMRQYAEFLLTDESLLKEVASVGGIRSILEGHLYDTSALPAIEPLSRKFIKSIKKPRVQELVNNIMTPISPDFSLVNFVLEAWFGPSLLPEKFHEQKDLVNFVETVLEIFPSNYRLAISVFKLFSRDYNSSEVRSASSLFWASSNLVTAILHAIPIPPEFVWVEAACILDSVTGIKAITLRFYKRALSVYPFSIKLWKSYYNIYKTIGDSSAVIQEARQKGIELG